LRILVLKFKSINPLVLEFEKPVVCDENEICVILKPESSTVRILGHGKIL